MELYFLGATGTVTGSKTLLSIGSKKILIDCGLFQGLKELRLRNWQKLPFNPHELDAIVLTHAHIDHSGYLPAIVKQGFKGPIYATPGSYELCKILLPDSGYLQEEEANFANRHGYSKHHPAKPLYTAKNAIDCLKQFVTVDFKTSQTLFENCQLKFSYAGHIIGASFAEITHKNRKIVFSGDIGRYHDPIMKDPEAMTEADYLIVESTYGNRNHGTASPKEELATIINDTIEHGGSVIIPAFAVGRTQILLHYLAQLKNENKIPSNIPIFLDSPMACDATDIFCKNQNGHKLTTTEINDACRVATMSRTQEESKEITRSPGQKIILSASGMAEGGRILHHLTSFGGNPKNTILLTGYQPPGSRGNELLNGKKAIRMLGQTIQINAQVTKLSNMSAHADANGIIEWLRHFKKAPKKVFINHGETEAAMALKRLIEKTLHWSCVVPSYLQKESLP